MVLNKTKLEIDLLESQLDFLENYSNFLKLQLDYYKNLTLFLSTHIEELKDIIYLKEETILAQYEGIEIPPYSNVSYTFTIEYAGYIDILISPNEEITIIVAGTLPNNEIHYQYTTHNSIIPVLPGKLTLTIINNSSSPYYIDIEIRYVF
jgi:hypothetical protein